MCSRLLEEVELLRQQLVLSMKTTVRSKVLWRKKVSHTLKLINALLCVALSDLPQCFVFVSARFHILSMEHVVLRLLRLISGLGQL